MKKNKKVIILVVCLIVFLLVCKFIIYNINNDGMDNTGINNVKYRTYSKRNGWSKWSKNGLTSGDLKNDIYSIEIKVSGDAGFLYSFYTEEKGWTETTESKEKFNKSYDLLNSKSPIKAVKFALFYGTTRYYSLCYRTHNKKNKWLEWTCDTDGISGNKDENINGIQMKMIPKNVIENEYLKDYNKKNIKPSLGF